MVWGLCGGGDVGTVLVVWELCGRVEIHCGVVYCYAAACMPFICIVGCECVI